MKTMVKNEMDKVLKDIDYTNLICWLLEHKDNDLNLFTKEDYDNEEWDKLKYCTGDTFYETLGIDIYDLEECLVRAYIRDNLENSIEFAVEKDSVVESYIVDVA